MKPAQLKVLEAYTRDVGRGIVRIDYDTMDKVGASTNDILRVTGKRTTYCRCLPLYPSDEEKGLCRIDGLGRTNASTAIGDTVKISKARSEPADAIVVTPLEAVPPIDERYLNDALEAVPMCKGDILMVPYFGGRLQYKVLETKPKGCIRMQKETQIKITDVKRLVKPSTNKKSIFSKVMINLGVCATTSKKANIKIASLAYTIESLVKNAEMLEKAVSENKKLLEQLKEIIGKND